MKVDLFAYGLLMYEDVLMALTGKVFLLQPATLYAHQRYSYVNDGWPKLAVVLPHEGACVSGVVIRDVDEDTLRLLDLFEGVESDLYCRSQVSAILASGTQVTTEIYLGTETTGSMTSGVWNETEFLSNHRRHYLDLVIPEFLKELEVL